MNVAVRSLSRGSPKDSSESVSARLREWQNSPRIRASAALVFLVVGSGLWLGPSWMASHPVSDLGTGPDGWLMNITFLGCGVVLGGPGYLMALLAFLPADTQLVGHFAVAWIMFGLMGGAVGRRFGLGAGLVAVWLLVVMVMGPSATIGLAERGLFVLWLAAAPAVPKSAYGTPGARAELGGVA